MIGPRAAVYAATKSYIHSFTSALQYEIAQQQPSTLNGEECGVSATLFTPGATFTNFVHSSSSSQSLIFRLPFVNTKDISWVVKQGVDGMMTGASIVTPGFVNYITTRLMPVLPISFQCVVCWILWGSWQQLRNRQ